MVAPHFVFLPIKSQHLAEDLQALKFRDAGDLQQVPQQILDVYLENYVTSFRRGE